MSFRNPLKIATLAISLLTATHSFGAEHPEKPLLWKVEGKGMEKPSYLFGTIHLGDKRVTTLHPAALKAFESADAVYTEVPMDTATQMKAAPMMMRKDGKTLNESIGPDLAARVNEELKVINPALDSTPFQPMATWAMGMVIPLLPDQLSGLVALDKTLWDKAIADKKEVGAIETIESQVNIFAEMTEEEQVIFLSETMRTLKKEREEGTNSMEQLLKAYISGNTGEVVGELNRALEEMEKGEYAEMGKKLMKRLLEDRDASMAKTIEGILAKEPKKVHFFAVGAAHLSTEKSIRSHLEEDGYTVTRIAE